MSGFDETEFSSYQPRHATSLRGHGAAERVLLEAFNAGRLPHGWLFTGPKGIGKSTLAFRFARFVLAQAGGATGGLFGMAPDSLDVPASDPVFSRIASFGHADLLTIERSWNDKARPPAWRRDIGVDDVRRIGGFFSMTASEGGYRICIVDAADEMNRNAANAVLKILEEPPPRSLIILVAHAPGSLLPTIRSRCRRLALRPLEANDLADILAEKLPDLAAADRIALARLAEGSPGRALALAAEGGLDLYRDLIALLQPLPQLDIGKLHALGDKMGRATGAASYRVFTDLLGRWLTRMIGAAAMAGGPSTGEIVPGEAALMQRLAGTRGLDQWVEVWENTSRLVARAESLALDRKQVMLNIFGVLERAARA